MNARQPRWISVAKASGDERTPVAPLGSKVPVADNIRHQLSEAVRNGLNPEPRLAWREGQAIAGKGWCDDREGIGRISPEPCRVRQPWDQLEKLEDGSWPAMGEEQGMRIRPMSRHMQELQINALQADFVLRQSIQPRLLSPPVEVIPPVLDEAAHVSQVGAVGPRLPWSLIGEARARQALP